MGVENKVIGTAPNDYKEHNATYDAFIRFSCVLTPVFLTWVVGLALGGFKHSWLIGGAFIILSLVSAAVGLASKELGYKPAAGVFVLSLLALLVL